MKQLFRNVKTVYKGFKTLAKTNKTPEESYFAMRQLFVQTNGRSNDLISFLVKQPGFDKLSMTGVLGIDNQTALAAVVNDIKENGYHVFKNVLPAEIINEIFEYASNTPVAYLETQKADHDTKPKKVIFDSKNPVSPRYDFDQGTIMGCDALQSLIFDSSLLAVAQSYLNTKPILDLIAMWWSAPFEGLAKSEAAQMYHFDLDRIKFLKFFFYITDVDNETGPHCYVKGSHKRLPPNLLKDGRHSDAEVEKGFGKENMVELCGRKGTIIAVDTRGLHKGKDLTRDSRLLFQIEFSNSMFGQYYPPNSNQLIGNKYTSHYLSFKEAYQKIFD